MFSPLKHLFFIPILAMLFAACGDDGGPGGPSDDPPELPVLEFSGPQTQTSDTGTAMVNGYVAFLNIYGFMPGAYVFGSPTGTGDGWRWSYTDDGVTYTMDAERTGNGIEWVLIVNGTDSGGHTYNNWVAFRVVMAHDGNSGSFTFYEENTNDPIMDMEWSVDGNGVKSAVVELYDDVGGPVSTRIELINMPNGSGAMTIRERSNGSLSLTFDSEWNPDGSGWWEMYDEEHNIIDSGEWI
jgi:hypothetical protein